MRYNSYTGHTFRGNRFYKLLPEAERRQFDVLSSVFHFKTNDYVLNNLINWDIVPDDPIYKMVFPQRGMLAERDFRFLLELFPSKLDESVLQQFVRRIRAKMRPRHVAAEGSIPRDEKGQPIRGLYSNFPTIVSLFPDPMVKTCHSYCNYCFRWIMFNNREVQQNSSYQDPKTPVSWLRANPQVTTPFSPGRHPRPNS